MEEKPSIEIIWELVAKFEGNEFTVSKVDEVLAHKNITFTTNNRRAFIASVLNRLEKSGRIERTSCGSGSIPNRFRLKSS